ncbi:ABC transporter permease [Candidatus Pacearchaeota archaeon]|nr:ABC transporter permease [Candidatus Pacearchaeota archaeon]
MKNHLFLAFTNLKRRKLRSWLTILGIFIGIAAVVSLISLGQGLQNFIDTQFEQLGADKIIIEPESFGPPGSVSDEQLILDDGDLKTIQNFRGVESAESILTRTGVIENKKEQEVVFINGVSEEYINLFDGSDFVEVIEGRQIKNSDNSKTVVGYNHVYGNIWENELRVGSSIEIKGKKFDIVGVLRKQGNPFDDNSIWIEKETLRNIFEIGNEEGIIVAKADSGFDVEVIAEGIRNELRNEKDQEEGEETFSVQTSAQLLETFSTIFTVIQAVFVGIAAISLVVGGIGIMNTMYTSVLERTKEIGTMKAVGAKNSDILFIFLFESGLLGLVGGIIGILLGAGIGKSVEYVATVQLGTNYLQAIFGWQLIIGAMTFSFIIGALSGVLPAMQAASLKPAEALRHA